MAYPPLSKAASAVIAALVADAKPDRHSVIGPSSAYAWRKCHGKIAMEKATGEERSVGVSAKVGTFQHHVAAFCLVGNLDAVSFLGYKENVEGVDFTFDEDMADLVQAYVDTVRNYVGDDGLLFVEQELDISWITGEDGAVGTADAIVIRDGQLVVIDLKTGRNEVEAEKNDQLTIYAMAALKAYNMARLVPVKYIEAPQDDADDLCGSPIENPPVTVDDDGSDLC